MDLQGRGAQTARLWAIVAEVVEVVMMIIADIFFFVVKFRLKSITRGDGDHHDHHRALLRDKTRAWETDSRGVHDPQVPQGGQKDHHRRSGLVHYP